MTHIVQMTSNSDDSYRYQKNFYIKLILIANPPFACIRRCTASAYYLYSARLVCEQKQFGYINHES